MPSQTPPPPSTPQSSSPWPSRAPISRREMLDAIEGVIRGLQEVLRPPHARQAFPDTARQLEVWNAIACTFILQKDRDC